MKRHEKSIELNGKKLTLSAGHIAMQASGAVMAQYGDTVVMGTVVSAKMKEDRGYFPLSVEYEEKLYAGGRIKGSRWVKRDGKPTDDEVLVARLIDRSIRPLFPEEYSGNDVQVILTVLSIDSENPPDMVAALAAIGAIAISPIPWMGPISALRVASNDGKFILNPTYNETKKSDLDLVVSSTKDAVVMIEMGGNEVVEKDVISAIEFVHKESKKIIDFVEDFAKECSVKKEVLEKATENKTIDKKVRDLLKGQVLPLAEKIAVKELGYEAEDELLASVLDNFENEEKKAATEAFHKTFKSEIRKVLLSGKHLDGRKNDQLRELSAEVGVLPRTHGSGLFQRGQTQALTIATLGDSSFEMLIETAIGEESRRYFHHYAMPPYSVGETGRIGSPNRREIGHGALAEKAIIPVLPSKEDFPYTMRVVTEILSSNGSTSMASVCGSTLSLMDAGVPISAPVAGIAMGVVIESEKEYKVLTDIVGIEDGNGDMDFKVAGTMKGITALQLDVKSLKLTPKMLKDAFDQARRAREEILSVLNKAISKPRPKVSEFAPKIVTMTIDTDKIGELIGPGGKTIKGIVATTGAQVDVDDSGMVTISAIDESAVEAAQTKVGGLTKDVKPGEIYEGEVKRIQPFGAFVEILPGKEGMVHVSDMSEDFVKDPADILKIGQIVKVRVKEIDDFKRINLSMLLDGDKKKKSSEDRGGSSFDRNDRNDRSSRNGRRSFSGRGRQGSFRNDRNDRNDRRKQGGRKESGGPHFPTSRLVDLDRKDFSR